MGQITFKEVLETCRDIDLLEDEGQPFYRHKQAAYRRKDALNKYWREHDLLWKWKSRGDPGDYATRIAPTRA